ncbi:ABC transporter domain-containing protein [Citrus sinensis]|uniref:ABC transporter domain-containing protein n=1 Tax=Citrus sinensis TaxID=2711 RepID=A0ACB8IKY8_CITSI|nr:ABC transporter domain-containing protein [Citrus sinensis]
MSSLDHSIPVPAISRAFEVVESSSNNKTATHSINVNEDDGDGVFLTWQDLWVTVPDGQKKGNRSILQGLTGYARPGELLAIMGPSGCGKSTLLDALAGRLGSNTRQAGEILINGRKRALAYGTSAYVTQDDALITTLTVSEAVYYSAQLQLPDTMTKLQKKERAEMTIKEMGLQDAMNTRIGGWGAKGLSGGQKRRVSICIEMLTRPKLLFLDEPTSGLDSAASYYFFALNGFPCPTLQNPSDHFLKTINKDFQEDIEEGLAGVIPTEEAIDILTKSYKSSDNYLQVRSQVAEICKAQDSGALEKKSAHADFLTQCIVLTSRSFVNMYRDLGYYWFRLGVYVLLGIGLATVFSNLGTDNNSIQARGSLLMFVASYLTFMTIGGFPSFVEDMKVFERERLNGHYGATAFVFGNTFSALPYLALISLIPGAIVYYLPGLHEGYQHFIYFVLLLFACMLLVESLMMIVASLVPNYLTGIITGAGIQGLMILGGGFFRLPNDLPHPFWKYPLYYIAFHKYAYQGMFKNEFEGLKFDNNLDGEQVLRDKWQLQMGYSKWVDLAILFGMVVFYRLVFLGIIKTVEKMKPVVKAFMSVPMKQTTQIMENPCATPPQEDKIFYQ